MNKKPENTASKATQSTSAYAKQRKIVIGVIIGVALIGLLVVSLKHNSNQNKFSDKDYAALSAGVEGVFRAVGGKDITKRNTCHYGTSGKYDFTEELYCTVKVAAHLTYESDEQAIKTAKSLERESRQLGEVTSYLSRFYDTPYEGHGLVGLTLREPWESRQCNISIDSNEKAKRAVNYLPEGAGNNLIVLSSECNAESRKQYFPLDEN